MRRSLQNYRVHPSVADMGLHFHHQRVLQTDRNTEEGCIVRLRLLSCRYETSYSSPCLIVACVSIHRLSFHVMKRTSVDSYSVLLRRIFWPRHIVPSVDLMRNATTTVLGGISAPFASIGSILRT